MSSVLGRYQARGEQMESLAPLPAPHDKSEARVDCRQTVYNHHPLSHHVSVISETLGFGGKCAFHTNIVSLHHRVT